MADQPSPGDEIARLKASMWKREFYVMTRRIVDASKLAPNALAHYRWIIGLEKQGLVMASGPLFERDGKQGVGMTIFRAKSFEEAEAHAARDPFVSSGGAEFELRRWQINEGRISLTIDFSDMTGAAD